MRSCFEAAILGPLRNRRAPGAPLACVELPEIVGQQFGVVERACEACSPRCVHRGPDGEGYGARQQRHLRSSPPVHHRPRRRPSAAGQRRQVHLARVQTARSTNYKETGAPISRLAAHRFLTHSDCEVIIGLYVEYGDKLVDHLRGMFCVRPVGCAQAAPADRTAIIWDRSPCTTQKTPRGFRVRLGDQGAAGIRPQLARPQPARFSISTSVCA